MTGWQSMLLCAVISPAIPSSGTALLPCAGQDIKTAAAAARPPANPVGRSGGNLKKKKAGAMPLAKKAGQFDADSLETQKAAVVKVLVKRANGSGEQATGLFVGTDGKNAYFITALHAITEDPNSYSPDLVKKIQLQFPHSAIFTASAATKISQALDLGLVLAPVANVPRTMPKIVMKDAVAGTPVHIIGNPAGGDWSIWSGEVQTSAVGGNPRLFGTGANGLVGGYSGGPVFDYDGAFLGMHTSTDASASYGTAAKSRSITEQLDAWNIPTDNLTTQPLPRPPGLTTTGPAPPSAEAEINKVLTHYETACSLRNADDLWKIWPSATAEQRKKFVDSFGAAKSITMRITDRSPVIDANGTSAMVTGQYSRVYVPKNGSEMKSSGPISFKLEKKNGVWVITSIM
jgi:hypothetical protein